MNHYGCCPTHDRKLLKGMGVKTYPPSVVRVADWLFFNGEGTAAKVSAALGISRVAARVRLRRAVSLGLAYRSARGVYARRPS